MLSKTFVFNRIQKTVDNIEDDLNHFLKDNEFKFATQNESVAKGKFIVTVVAVKGKSSIRCKVFKDQVAAKVDAKVNTFLSKNGMKFMTQTFVGSNIYTIVFFDSKAEQTPTPPTGNTTDGTNQN